MPPLVKGHLTGKTFASDREMAAEVDNFLIGNPSARSINAVTAPAAPDDEYHHASCCHLADSINAADGG